MSLSSVARRNRPAHGCPLCGSALVPGMACSTCYAPIEVIQSILDRRRPPHYIGVLGPSGVGKTVYLGMLLDLLGRGVGGLHGTSRGPFTVALHRNLLLALEGQRFPEKTPNEPDRWHWIHSEVTTAKRGTTFDIVTPDVAGEAVQGELERPRSNPTVRTLIARCSGLVVLVDIQGVVAGGHGQELFAMQLINYLDNLQGVTRRKIPVPVAVVFTKSDLCQEPVRDPAAFARANASGLWRLCESRLAKFQFFCAGIAGATGWLVDAAGNETLVPLRVEPRNVVEPFSWIIGQLR